MVNARECALRILYQVETQLAYSNIVIDDIIQKNVFNTLDKSFAIQLVYGIIRRQNTLDYIILKFIDNKDNFSRLNKWLLLILRMGVYQIIYLDKVPNYSAVDESVKLAKSYGPVGSSKFVNAVLRNVCEHAGDLIKFEGEPENIKLALHLSHPVWLIERLTAQFGKLNATKICESNNINPHFTIRVNTLKITREALMEALRDFEPEPCRLVPDGITINNFAELTSTNYFKEGYFYIQDEASMLVAHIVDPQPMEVVFDFCASPGGKTTHLAQITKNQSLILAYDRFSHKIQKIKDNCKRLDITCVTPKLQDILKMTDTRQAHRVLVDVPCSCLGIVRRHPELKWRLEEKNFDSIIKIQYQLLEIAAEHTTPGGVIVYSACTYEPGETINLINRFLKNNPGYEFMPFPEHIINNFKDNGFNTETAEIGYQSFFPHVHGIDGFFVAKLRKLPADDGDLLKRKKH
ncbi:MAG: 16S rRNA (cytosine(967)-C(5))-methyltransferase RsmB [Candidatus Wallbacteria bacterium]